MDYLRNLVSGDKKREMDNNVSLDLSYITPRMIAMAYPASGLESSYRNPINSVSNFLNSKHKNHYLIFNVSGREYDYSKFNFQVLEYDWINHQSPPLNILFEICLKMQDFLKKDKNNIICVNCVGGKGRTGTIICCFLLYTGVCRTVDEALVYYAKKRFVKGRGVTQPSQKRYIQYFYEIINKDVKYPYSIEINKIIVSQLPSYLRGKNSLSIDLLLNYTNKIPIINEALTYIPNDLANVVLTPKNFCMIVCGDISFKIASTSLVRKTTIGRVAFNTAFIPIDDNRIKFTIDQIDPDHLVNNSSYPKGFCIEILYNRVCDCQDNNSVNDPLCQKCKIKNETELEKWKFINLIVQDYQKKGSCRTSTEGKLLLFGNDSNDIKVATLGYPIIGNSTQNQNYNDDDDSEDEDDNKKEEKKEDGSNQEMEGKHEDNQFNSNSQNKINNGKLSKLNDEKERVNRSNCLIY